MATKADHVILGYSNSGKPMQARGPVTKAMATKLTAKWTKEHSKTWEFIIIKMVDPNAKVKK